jgi:hypothetical protein
MQIASSTERAENVLKFVSQQVPPINFLDYPGIDMWSADCRRTEILIIKAVEIAAEHGFPFRYIRNKLFITFFDELISVSDELLDKYLSDCMDRYGIPKYDKENILNNKN